MLSSPPVLPELPAFGFQVLPFRVGATDLLWGSICPIMILYSCVCCVCASIPLRIFRAARHKRPHSTSISLMRAFLPAHLEDGTEQCA